MKKVKVKDASKCYACYQCMNACSTTFYKEYDEEKSCIRVGLKDTGVIAVRVCVQCGKCAKACPAGAITQNAKGVYTINKKLCVGCGVCKETCPFGVCLQADDTDYASKCIACGICAKACPMDVLEVVES